MEIALDIINNFINSESTDSTEDAWNIHKSNSKITITVPNAMLLPYNFDSTFTDIASEKEENEV